MRSFILHALSAALLSVHGYALHASAQQIAVGANVHVSRDNPNVHHRELWAGADLTSSDRLIACAFTEGHQYQGDTIKAEFYVSPDRGKTWNRTLSVADGVTNADEVCEFGPGGVVYAMSLSLTRGEAARTLMYRSGDGGLTWDRDPARFGLIDRPTLAIDNTGGEFHGRVYAFGQEFIYGLHGQRTRAALLYRSLDGGRTFVGPAIRYVPAVGGGMSGPISGSSVVLSDGTYVVPFFMRPEPDPNPSSVTMPRMALAVSRSTDGGETLEAATTIATLKLNRSSIVPSLAADPSPAFKDRLYVVWSDSAASGRSRVYLSYSTDNGKSWSVPRPVDDTRPYPGGAGPDGLPGPEVLFPVVKVNQHGVVGVSWYDKRAAPDNLGWDLHFAASFDGGETFAPSVRVSEQTSLAKDEHMLWQIEASTQSGSGGAGAALNFGVLSLEHPYWDTNGMAVGADGTFHPIWIDLRTGRSQVWTAPVSAEGTVARHGSRENAALVDVSDQVEIEVSKPVFDRKSGHLTGVYRVRNASEHAIHGPLKLRLVLLEGNMGEVSTRGADNGVDGVGAVWDWTLLLNGGVLAPGEMSQGREIAITVSDARMFGPKAAERTDIARTVFRVLARAADAAPP